jgi:hypothetical protein
MRLQLKDKTQGIMTVPIGLAIVFAPFSLLIGWNLLTLVIFWFGIVPGLSISLPRLVSSNNYILLKSLIGMILFYALMVFMIYEHYQTDYFQVMIVSCVFNLALVSLVILMTKTRPHNA